MTTEHLAGLYFRLNGFFTIPNFILHPVRRGAQRTEADIVGVRFPYRSEFPNAVGGDDAEFSQRTNKPYFVIAEVKRSMCMLNGPWTNKKKGNINSVLRDLGPFRPNVIGLAAESLYVQGFFDSSEFYCSLFCVGDTENPDIAGSYPKVPQRTWEQLLQFFFDRFQTYRNRKADHANWDQVGKDMWNYWSRSSSKQQFIATVRQQVGLTTADPTLSDAQL